MANLAHNLDAVAAEAILVIRQIIGCEVSSPGWT